MPKPKVHTGTEIEFVPGRVEDPNVVLTLLPSKRFVQLNILEEVSRSNDGVTVTEVRIHASPNVSKSSLSSYVANARMVKDGDRDFILVHHPLGTFHFLPDGNLLRGINVTSTEETTRYWINTSLQGFINLGHTLLKDVIDVNTEIPKDVKIL